MGQPDFFAAAPSAPAYVPDPRFGAGPAAGSGSLDAGPSRAPQPGMFGSAAPGPAGHAHRRKGSLRRTRMILGGVVAVIAVAGYLGVNHLASSASTAETKTVNTALQAVRDTQVKSDLQRAATAMEASFAAQSAYPRDLAAAGYAADTATTVRLVWSDGSGYCLAGGPVGAAPTWWFANQQGGLVRKPC